ncbi:MAG: hypothetical protein AAF497_21090, partial [Planctomycetota bacterium]
MHFHFRPLILVSTATILFLTIGCSSSSKSYVDLKNSHIATVAGLYSQFQAANRGRMPKDAADFKKYINETAKGTLDKMGLATADDLLTSERDGQPIKVLYGKHGMTPDGIEVIAHEETGV